MKRIVYWLCAFVLAFGVYVRHDTVQTDALFYSLGFISASNAADGTQTFSVSPDTAKAVDQAVTLNQLADKVKELGKCRGDNKTCEDNFRKYQSAFSAALHDCHPDCDEQYYLEHHRCPATDNGGAAQSAPQTPRAKAIASGAKIKFIPCLPPSVAKDGVCWCDDARVQTGDVTAAKTFGQKQGACVPTIQLFDRFVEETHRTFNYACEPADGVDVPPEELAKAGITERLSADDPRCKRTGEYIKYLLYLSQEFRKKQLTPDNWWVVWQDYLNRHNGPQKLADGDDSIAQIKTILDNHEHRITILERKWQVQLLGTGLANLRFADGSPKTLGLRLDARIIDMVTPKNGVAFGLGFGYGKQPHSQMALWMADISWYHVFNPRSTAVLFQETTTTTTEETTEEGTKKNVSTRATSSESPSTLYAMRLGGCLQGGWLVNNVQDEMSGGACGGFQIIPSNFVIDLGLMVGYGRYGLYDPATSQRIGYSALRPVLGFQIGFGANLL